MGYYRQIIIIQQQVMARPFGYTGSHGRLASKALPVLLLISHHQCDMSQFTDIEYGSDNAATQHVIRVVTYFSTCFPTFIFS